jgi:hypothetical protein
VLEGDALEVVNVLRTNEIWLGRYGHIVQDARDMLRQCQEWQINHVHRQGNSVAHGLAKLALNIQQEMLWTENFPFMYLGSCKRIHSGSANIWLF